MGIGNNDPSYILKCGLVLIGLAVFVLFYGMRALIALIVKKGKGNKQLHVFTFRQIQELSLIHI